MAALAVGAVSLFSPPLAVLGLALLAARVLFGGESVRIDWLTLIGPALAALIVGLFFGLPGAIGDALRVAAVRRHALEHRRSNAPCRALPDVLRKRHCKALAHAWMTPLFGLMLVAYTAPHMIAGLPLDLPHVPVWLVIGVGILAAGAVFDWGLQRAADWRLANSPKRPRRTSSSTTLSSCVAFGLMIDVSAGVVMLIAWRLAHAAPLASELYGGPVSQHFRRLALAGVRRFEPHADHRIRAERLRVLDHAVERLLAAFSQELGVFVDFTADDHPQPRYDIAPDKARAHDVAAHQAEMLRHGAAVNFKRGGNDHLSSALHKTLKT